MQTKENKHNKTNRLGSEIAVFSGSRQLWPAQRLIMRITTLWPLVPILLSTLGTASLREHAGSVDRESLLNREQMIFRPAAYEARFQDVPPATRARCEATEPPQELATPGPLQVALEDDAVTVTFIVGTDGNVHSPLILQGDDSLGNRLVLDAIRHWKYRPATCNGVPTEVEGKVEFSRR